MIWSRHQLTEKESSLQHPFKTNGALTNSTNFYKQNTNFQKEKCHPQILIDIGVLTSHNLCSSFLHATSASEETSHHNKQSIEIYENKSERDGK